jgi:hypothetical protein
MSDALDKFGRLLIEAILDRSMDNFNLLRHGGLKAKSAQKLQAEFAKLPEETVNVVDAVVLRLLTGAVHDFLFALQDAHDRDLGVEIHVDGVDVVNESGMLQGECFGETGWISRFSRHAGTGALGVDKAPK